MSKPQALPVIFRAERSGYFKGVVTAVFPTEPGTYDGATFAIYAHIGQHGSGSRGWYAATRAAKPAEYAELLAELREIYETGDDDAVKLEPIQRFTQRHDEARRNALAAL